MFFIGATLLYKYGWYLGLTYIPVEKKRGAEFKYIPAPVIVEKFTLNVNEV